MNLIGDNEAIFTAFTNMLHQAGIKQQPIKISLSTLPKNNEIFKKMSVADLRKKLDSEKVNVIDTKEKKSVKKEKPKKEKKAKQSKSKKEKIKKEKVKPVKEKKEKIKKGRDDVYVASAYPDEPPEVIMTILGGCAECIRQCKIKVCTDKAKLVCCPQYRKMLN